MGYVDINVLIINGLLQSSGKHFTLCCESGAIMGFMSTSKPRQALFVALAAFLAALTVSPVNGQVQQSRASYDARLSGWCQSVGEGEKIASASGDYRVRKGGVLTATGFRQAVFVEDGGVVDLSGTASVLYVAKGAKVTVSGERNQIFAELGGNVFLKGKATLTMVGELNLQVNKNSSECQ